MSAVAAFSRRARLTNRHDRRLIARRNVPAQSFSVSPRLIKEMPRLNDAHIHIIRPDKNVDHAVVGIELEVDFLGVQGDAAVRHMTAPSIESGSLHITGVTVEPVSSAELLFVAPPKRQFSRSPGRDTAPRIGDTGKEMMARHDALDLEAAAIINGPNILAIGEEFGCRTAKDDGFVGHRLPLRLVVSGQSA